MATVRKTITIAALQDAGVRAQIEAIRAALIEAENSGEPQPFDPEAFKRRMQKTQD